MLAERQQLPALDLRERLSLPLAERELDALGQARAVVGPHHHPVDHDLDVVLLALVERGDLVEPVHLSVDPDPREAAGREALEDVLELALAVLHERREQGQPGALRERGHLAGDLLGALTSDDLAAVVAALDASARVEHAEVVVDLGDGADGRARVARGALLLDGDGRREAAEALHVGALEASEELPRVRAEALDVATLPLGEQGVEGQGRLARAAHPGEDHERALGQLEGVDRQVVLVGADDLDPVELARAVLPGLSLAGAGHRPPGDDELARSGH